MNKYSMSIGEVKDSKDGQVFMSVSKYEEYEKIAKMQIFCKLCIKLSSSHT